MSAKSLDAASSDKIDGSDVIKKLKRAFGAKNESDMEDASLATRLGLSPGTLRNWRQHGLTPLRVAYAVERARAAAGREAEMEAIKPIIEFLPIYPARSPQGARLILFAKREKGRSEDHPHNAGLRKTLENTHGVYVFHDSRGRALYVGKSEKSSLWDEMNSAFNRDRAVQTVRRVEHPSNNVRFQLADERLRPIKPVRLPLSDMADYVSAYAVSPGLVSIVESMLMRSFANDVLNVRMERFGGGRQDR